MSLRNCKESSTEAIPLNISLNFMPTRHRISSILFYGSFVADCSETQNNLHGRLHTTKTHLYIIKSNFLEIFVCTYVIGQDNI